MKRKILISTVALLVFTITVSPISGGYGYTTPTVTVQPPKLEIVTIPEDDQVRQTGIIVLGMSPPGGYPGPVPGQPVQQGSDMLAQFKIIITADGAPIFRRGSDTPLIINCQIIQKDKLQPKIPQFPQEDVQTVLTDISPFFVCKFRWTSITPGYDESVGVLDVYYIGPTNRPFFIGDHVLAVSAIYTIPVRNGNGVRAFATEMQDICLLGWSMGQFTVQIPLSSSYPNPEFHYVWDNPLGAFFSCEDAALYQRTAMGVPIGYMP